VKINKIFFDANIFNDIFDEERKNHADSKASLIYALQNDISVCTSCDIVTNIYYITAKYTGKKEALDALTALKETVEIIPFAYDELSATIKLMQSDSNYSDLEDTIQYTLALKQKSDLIITNDKKFASKKIKLLSSEQFVNEVVNLSD